MGLINPWSIGTLLLLVAMFVIMGVVSWRASNGSPFSSGCERCECPLADNQMADGTWICDDCYAEEVDFTMDRILDREIKKNA